MGDDRHTLRVTRFGGSVFYALIVQLSYVLDGIGVTSTTLIGASAAVMSIATAIGGAVFDRLSRIGLRRLLSAEFAISGIGLLVVFAGTSVPLVLLGAVLTGFGTGLRLPTLPPWAVRDLTFVQRGRGTGIWTGTLASLVAGRGRVDGNVGTRSTWSPTDGTFHDTAARQSLPDCRDRQRAGPGRGAAVRR